VSSAVKSKTKARTAKDLARKPPSRSIAAVRGDNPAPALKLAPLPFGFSLLGMHATVPASNLMVVAAVRYCLGRRTYIVHECASWLLATWPLMSPKMRTNVAREIEDAFSEHATLLAIALRTQDPTDPATMFYSNLGDVCDIAAWRAVRTLWKAPECLRCSKPVRDAGVEATARVHLPGSLRLMSGLYVCPACRKTNCVSCQKPLNDGQPVVSAGPDGADVQCMPCRTDEIAARLSGNNLPVF
jgi:hypothetical protein